MYVYDDGTESKAIRLLVDDVAVVSSLLYSSSCCSSSVDSDIDAGLVVFISSASLIAFSFSIAILV